MLIPQLLYFETKDMGEKGFLSIAQNSQLPFVIKRIYWLYDTQEGQQRGSHAFKSLHKIIIAPQGEVEAIIENQKGNEYHFILKEGNMGLYIPPLHWFTLKTYRQAVIVVLASEEYTPDEYIKEYKEFKTYNNSQEIIPLTFSMI